jgi:chaperone modulatory protein CbpM
MTRFVTEDDLIASVPRLTRTRLTAFVAAEVIVPVGSEHGPVFHQIDRARAALACDLAEDFDLHEDALCMVLSLLDQLHGVRGELRAVLGAVESEPTEVRRRIAETLFTVRRGG